MISEHLRKSISLLRVDIFRVLFHYHWLLTLFHMILAIICEMTFDNIGILNV